ncbi:MAG: phosphoglycerate kinase [bacterium]|nr:phosphoglycerate kinase [bacterium]
MPLKYIDQIDLKQKRVFVRVDFNVALDKKTGAITDDTRIRACLPTIQYALENNARVVLASHLGRPKGEVIPHLSLLAVGERLSDLLKRPVLFPEDCVGDGVRKLASDMNDGDVMLLENLRFHKEETDNNPQFAASLAALGEVYINDAFGTCHRAHASTAGMVSHFQEKGAGFLIQKELNFLNKLMTKPERPFVAILGGAKVSDKIGVIENLLTKVDAIAIGGGMAYTFLAAQGIAIGKSLFEEEKVHLAKKILDRAVSRGVAIHLPVDHIASSSLEGKAETTPGVDIADDRIGLDIGPKTLENFSRVIRGAKTIFWNGPLGLFENAVFARGTLEIAKVIAKSRAVSVAGGGDSLAAIKKAGVADKIGHLSTGGGATLEFLEGKKLPGLVALEI